MQYYLFCGDSAEILKQFDDNSVDSCVTDPPYALDLLEDEGVDWDHDTGNPEVWEQVYRVLKPGAFCAAFSAPRTYHRLATQLEGIGFEIKDQIQWIFGQSLPRAQDLGKLWEKEIEKALDEANPRYLEPDGHGVRIDLDADGKLICYGDKQQITESVRANRFYGLKNKLRPGSEPICLAQKPREGSILENYRKWQTGVLNIKECTIDDFGQKQSGTDTFDGYYPSDLIGEVPQNQKYFYCPKTGEWERNFGVGQKQGRSKRDNRRGMASTEHPNDHLTVKPIALMAYLARLVTPNKGFVIDPFSGSFTTGLGCLKEGISRFAGIELQEKYRDIGFKRFAAWRELLYREADDEFVKIEGSLPEVHEEASCFLNRIAEEEAKLQGVPVSEVRLPPHYRGLMVQSVIESRIHRESERQNSNTATSESGIEK
jgi:site-specific DNA-methyltransferase (adenine-specific)